MASLSVGEAMAWGEMNSYDLLPYPAYPRPATHPDRLAAVAWLAGLESARVERCRVLEIGCSDGGNLLPMAHAFPDSEFVGVDLSRRQVEQGRAAASSFGLRNLRLEPADLCDLPTDLGRFDYVLAHGVFSWVPADVQAALLDACRLHLAPRGVAFVSYNTYPGWHGYDLIRGLMLYAARGASDPLERVRRARQALAGVAAGAAADEAGYQAFLRDAEQKLSRVSDAYLFHEYLEETNRPVYFHEFVAQAARHGLQYLAEAQFHTLFGLELPAASELGPHAGRVEREQHLDFLRRRTFRQSLLCLAETAPATEIEPGRVAQMMVASCADPDSPVDELGGDAEVVFRVPAAGHVSVRAPVAKAAMVVLAERWPVPIPFAELCAEARSRLGSPPEPTDESDLGFFLITCHGADLVRLHRSPKQLVRAASERPVASLFARLQAESSDTVTNPYHELVRLDPTSRAFLLHLDGRHDRQALIEAVARRIESGAVALEVGGERLTDSARIRTRLEQGLEPCLRLLARAALLIA